MWGRLCSLPFGGFGIAGWKTCPTAWTLIKLPLRYSQGEEELVQIEMSVMDGNERAAFRLLKEFLERLEQQKNLGLKSHLD